MCVGSVQRLPCRFCFYAVKHSSAATSLRKGRIFLKPSAHGGFSSAAGRIHDERLFSYPLTTCRNIYYQNPQLFQSQDYVDRLVDDIAYSFGVGRSALNIVSQNYQVLFTPGALSLTPSTGCRR